MKNKILVISLVVLILVLALGGYYFWKTKIQKPAALQTAGDIQKTAADISSDVSKNIPENAVPSTIAPVNVNANPYQKTNPFSNLKTNPFQ